MKAEFKTPLRVELSSYADHWRLFEPLEFYSARFNTTIIIPAGFFTDFASVPRLPLAFLVAGDKARMAAVVHDFALEHLHMSRADCALLFLEAMEATNIPEGLRQVMYAAVRINDKRYETNDFPLPEGD